MHAKTFGTWLAALTFPLFLNGETSARPAKADKLTITSLQVNRTAESSDYLEDHRETNGLSLNFILTTSDCHIIKLAPEPLRVLSYSDDQGHEMSSGVGIKLSPWRSNSREADDHTMSLWLNAGKAPPHGALKVHLKGEMSLLCSWEDKKALRKEVTLEKDAIIHLGSLSLKVVSMTLHRNPTLRAKTALMITLTLESNLPVSQIRTLRILDLEGVTLADLSQYFAQDSNQFSLQLRQKITRALIEVEYYEKADTAIIPLDLETGIGL